MKKITYLIFLLAIPFQLPFLPSQKEGVFRRVKSLSSPEFVFSYLKSEALLELIKEDLFHPELQKILSDLKNSGINKLYFIELFSPDQVLPGAGKNFPEVQDLLKKELGIEIKGEDSGIILLPTYLVKENMDKRRVILLHEFTHILKDVDPEVGRKEFNYYQSLLRELNNLKTDIATGDEIITPLEEKFLGELVSTVGNFILMRYLVERNLLSYVHPYLEVKIGDYARRLEEQFSNDEKEILFKLAYFLTVTPFSVLEKSSIHEEKIKKIFESHLRQEKISEIIMQIFFPLKKDLQKNSYPNLYLLRRYFFKKP